jgi:hypothetical protein
LAGYQAEYVPGYSLVAPSTRSRTGRTALVIVAGVVAACCAGGATLVLLASALLKGATSSIGPAPPGLNTAVRDGRFEFVVTSFSCHHEKVGRSIITKQAQGQYCLAALTVRNIGKDKQTFADSYQKALAPDGTIFGADTGAGLIVNENIAAAFNVINPGNQVTSKIVYDIPEEATIAKLELHDSPFSRGVTVTLT